LRDADSLIKAIEEKAKRLSNADTINGLCGAVALIFDAPTIIEAEKTTINHEKTTITDGDLISRESVITMLNKIENAVEDGDGFQFNEWVEYAKDITSAEKTAVFKIVGNTKQHYECSKCNEQVDGWDKFCKHCGARLVL
jgi:hypothetical protein